MSNVSEIQFAVEKSVLDIGVKIVFPGNRRDSTTHVYLRDGWKKRKRE